MVSSEGRSHLQLPLAFRGVAHGSASLGIWPELTRPRQRVAGGGEERSVSSSESGRKSEEGKAGGRRRKGEAMVSDSHSRTGRLVATPVPLGTAIVHKPKPQTKGLGEVQIWVQAGPRNPKPTFVVSQEHAA